MKSKKVAKIKLGEKMRSFYFGLGFLGLFIEESGVSLEDIDEELKKNPFKRIPQIMYYSLAFGFVKQELEIPFKVYDVIDWIDNDGGIGGPAVAEFLKAFNENSNANLPENEKKKTAVNPTARKK